MKMIHDETNSRRVQRCGKLATMSGTQLPVHTPARGIWSASLRGPKRAGSAALRPVQCGVQHYEMHILQQTNKQKKQLFLNV